MRVSIVIPVHGCTRELQLCLRAIRRSRRLPDEVILVVDGKERGERELAETHGFRCLSLPKSGPAAARNLGAAHASGDCLFFIDSDVCLKADTLEKLLAFLEREKGYAAVFGSYDMSPGRKNFFSSYKNLSHAFFHKLSGGPIHSFWSGCGMIRKKDFWAVNGFDERFTRPCIEDVELGYRLSHAGRLCYLLPSAEVKHLKRWTLWGMARSDIQDRALPWIRILARSSTPSGELNLGIRSRLCGLISLLVVCAGAGVSFSGAAPLALSILAFVGLAFPQIDFLRKRRGIFFSIRSVPVILLYYVYSTALYGAFYPLWKLEYFLESLRAGDPVRAGS